MFYIFFNYFLLYKPYNHQNKNKHVHNICFYIGDCKICMEKDNCKNKNWSLNILILKKRFLVIVLYTWEAGLPSMFKIHMTHTFLLVKIPQ